MSQPDLQPGPQPPRPSGSAGGCALFAIGLLMLIPSGLCTAFGGFLLLSEAIQHPSQIIGNLSDLSPFILITIVPLVLGIILVRAGMRNRE